MKFILLSFLFVSLGNAQNVGINTPSPDPSAILDVKGTQGGLLPPRLTTAQRDAIPSPAQGLMIYNTDTYCMEYWNGTKWISTCVSAPPCSPPPASSPSSNGPVCIGSTLSLTASPVPGATYVWTTPVGNTHTGEILDLANVSFSDSGKYSLSTWALGCYSDPDTLEVDIVPSNWKTIGAIPAGITTERGGTWSILNNTIYFMAGSDATNSNCQGSDMWAFDIATGVWTQKADYPGLAVRSAHSFAIDGKLYHLTGWACSNFTVQSNYYVYDPATDTWGGAIAAPGGPRHVGWAQTMNGKAYYGFGGPPTGCGSPLTDFWEYDPTTTTWTQKASFPDVKSCSGKAFAIGDDFFFTNSLGNMYKWNAGTDVWTDVTDIGAGVVDRCFAVNGLGYLVKTDKSVWSYDPAADSWMRMTCDFPGGSLFGQHTGSLSASGKAYFMDLTDRIVWEFTP